MARWSKAGEIWFLVWNFLKIYLIAIWCLIEQLMAKHRIPNEASDHHGDVAIVTGGARGIGYHITRKLVSCGMHVIIGCKYEREARQAIASIQADYPAAKVDFLELDLASFTSVLRFVQAFESKELPLHLLINNAGVMMVPYQLTENKIETHLQVNYLSHFLLTNQLLPKLSQSQTSGGRCSRIVNVSSHAHYWTDLDRDEVEKCRYYSSHNAYCVSKLAVLMWTYKLQRHLVGKGDIIVNAVHPGIVETGLYTHLSPLLRPLVQLVLALCAKSPAQGADTVLYAALSPDLEGRGRGYYDNCQSRCSGAISYDTELQDWLWKTSGELVGLPFTG